MATDPSERDPFGPQSGRTFITPKPGAARADRVTQTGGGGEIPMPEQGLNPLLALANKLLVMVPQIRATARMDDPSTLRQALGQGIREFSQRAQAQGIAPDRIAAARYVLCTLLDEAASDTPWGGDGTWSRTSLLTQFHDEAFGGDKVFQLMARLAQNPQEHRELLELIYVALALGFEGRYRVAENGAAKLDAVRDKLARILREARGPYPPALAEHWAVRVRPPRRALSWLPLAAAAALAALVLGALYLWATLSLSQSTDPVFARIQSLRMASPWAAVAAPLAAPAAAGPQRLAPLLAQDAGAGWLSVRDEADRSVVVLRGDGLFDSGSARVSDTRAPVITRVAQALARHPGTVRVTGHTDNQAIRSARFPSNWHLSEERARGVAQLLAASGVGAERLSAEGRADGEPLMPNSTPEQRALNRRVEILLLPGRLPLPATAPPIAPSGAKS
jgi:type VI secretion system protein ImpK